jgi:hypothetical protein
MLNEELLNYIWFHKLYDFNRITVNGTGEKPVIINPGTRNTDSGPDFFNARIKTGRTTWAGNVEVHVKSSDWKEHNHQNDDAYDNIILHVVYEDNEPVFRKNGEKIPTVELKGLFDEKIISTYQSFIRSSAKIACGNQLKNIDRFSRFAWMESLCIERLEEKANVIQDELENSGMDFQEIFYRKLGRNFGFNTNADAFELLTKSLPFSVIGKHTDRQDQLESLLYGQAGMLNGKLKDDYPVALNREYRFLKEKYKLKPIEPKVWKFLRMRPFNFPSVRISQFAGLLHASSGLLTRILEHNNLNDLYALFSIEASEYWHDHSRFDKKSKPKSVKLGISSVDLILINTVIPFSFIYGKLFRKEEMQDKALLWYEKIKPEKNHVTRDFLSLGLQIENAKQSQAVLQLKNNYCDKKRCLDCRFGHLLISGKT